MQSFLSSLCTLTRLYSDEGVLDVVVGEKKDELESGTDLQDLVADEDYDELVSEQCPFKSLLHQLAPAAVSPVSNTQAVRSWMDS